MCLATARSVITSCWPMPCRLDELVTVQHPILQGVADATHAVGQQFVGVKLFDVLGQHQNRETLHVLARREGRTETLVGEKRAGA